MHKPKNMDIILEADSSMSLFDKIYLEHLKERRIILNAEIGETLIELLVMPIKQFNLEDDINNVPIKDRKPIHVYINSSGGSVYDGFAAIGAIKTSKTKVITHVDGYVMSMGFGIYLAGHERTASPYSNFMYHEISTSSWGKNQEIQRVTQENKRLQKMYDSLVIEQTNIKQETLDNVKETLRDWFFDAHEAVKMGIVHKIIS